MVAGEDAQQKIAAAEDAHRKKIPFRILVCMGGGCIASGAARIKGSPERSVTRSEFFFLLSGWSKAATFSSPLLIPVLA